MKDRFYIYYVHIYSLYYHLKYIENLLYILKQKHLDLMCSYYIGHVAASRYFENKDADVSP